MPNIPPHTDAGLLTKDNCAVVFIDHQPQMSFGVGSHIDRQLLVNNVVMLAKGAKIFGVPAILTTVETESFSGYMWPQLLDVFPDQSPIERTGMNSWDTAEFRQAIETALGSAKTGVVVDLSRLEYMDSSGVAVLIEGVRWSKEKKVTFMLAAPTDAVREVIELARLQKFFSIHDEVESAVKEVQG